jgi:hypothetical protein
MRVRWLVLVLLLASAGHALADDRAEEPPRVELTFDMAELEAPEIYPELGVEVPWLWRHIREAVIYSERRLPHHTEETFSVLVAPCVVSNGYDRVAGVGIEGYF